MSELEIFTEALAHSAEARGEFLDRACTGDAELRQRLDTLLKQHETADSLLDRKPQEMVEALTTSEGLSEDWQAEAARVALFALQGFFEPSTRPDSLGRLGHYELLSVLGQGGYGAVFKSFDTKLNRLVAIKILLPQLAATSPARRRFIREARAAAAVQHQNVVQIFAVEETPIPYLVMEFVSGETLQQRSERLGPFDPAEVVKIGLQIARGLEAAHEKGIIHRDIKPGNIQIEDGVEPRAKLCDFGLARAADDASTSQSGVVFGTPMYMSPEQVRGDELDQRSDLFSFGSMLYLMTAGRPPFRAPSTLAVLKRVVDDTPRSLRDVMPGTPEGLFAVISRLHAKSRDERYASIRDVIADLEMCLTAMPSELRCRANERRFSNVLKLAAWVGAAVVMLGVLISELAGWTQLVNRGQPDSVTNETPVVAVVSPQRDESKSANNPTSTDEPMPTADSNANVAAPDVIAPGFIVTSTLDDGSDGTLRWAINEANQHAGEDTISFDRKAFAEPQTITLKEGPLHLLDSAVTTITGPASGLTISGDNKGQVFIVGAGFEVTEPAAKAVIADLTVTKGQTTDVILIGGGVLVRGGATLTMIGCLLCNNVANHFNGGGGGVFNGDATLVMVNCTLTQNEGFEGAAIKNYAGKSVLTNCTIVKNTAERGGGGIYTGGFNRARCIVSNCLFSANPGNDIYSFDGMELSGDFNIGSDDSMPGTFSRKIVDARLGPLARHGGPTETYSLQPDSPAKDSGDNDRLPSNIRKDQRGLPRVVNGTVDIGAFEVQ